MNSQHSTTDEAIERTLAHLGRTQAPEDLNARLHARLQIHSSPVSSKTAKQEAGFTRWLNRLVLNAPLPWSITACGLVVLLLLGFRLSRAFTGDAPLPNSTHSGHLSPAGPSVASNPDLQQPSRTATNPVRSNGTLSSAPLHLSVGNVPEPPPAAALVGAVLPTQAALDSQALEDLNAPSQPALSSGPTRQEQLLKQVIQGGNSATIANLEEFRDPGRISREQAAFHSFFEPRSLPASEPAKP